MKVLRDAGACHFDVPLAYDLSWLQIEELLPAGCHVFLADSSGSDNSSVVDYTRPKYSECSHAVLVIGGETEGLSRTALQLCSSSKWKAQRVHIPMSAGVDSLNSAVSASVILCEIWRQMLLPSVDENEIHQLG